MKIKLKTLKGKLMEINISDAFISVLELKNQIAQDEKIEVNSIKLIFNGVILDDKKSLDNYGIKEDSVLIYMTSKVTKKNEDNTVKKEEPKKEEVKSDNKPEEIKKSEVKPKENKPISNYSDQMTQLLEMGFDQAKCLQAISAAKGSVPIAIEYLYNGIPPNLEGNQDALEIGDEEDDNDNEDNEPHIQGEGGEPVGISPELLDNMDLSDPNALSHIASILKILISHDPSILQELMEEVEETNPEIIEFIRKNDTQFKQLMSQPVSEEDYAIFENILGPVGGSQANIADGDEEYPDNIDQNPLEEITKDFTDKDRESIQNLVSLGFSEFDAIQAYIACDKNEANAANFLFQDKN